MTKILDKDRRKEVRRSLKKVFKKENITKTVVILATLALIVASVLPYLLI